MEMWRSKKFIIVAVLAAVVLLGGIGGVALAQTENSNNSQPESKYGTLLSRVCEIYQEKTGVAIDQAALKDAFTQAQSELRTEALKNRLQSLVDQGKITQDQADQYLKWMESRPDVPFKSGLRGMGGIHGWGGPSAPTQ
jgi:hypothetical protein